MGTSRNHHFIPQFFIEEFTDNKGRVFLYNKKQRKFEENKNTKDAYLKETFKPEKIFFVKDLNAISFSGQRKDIIEKYLNDSFDNPYSKYFQYILNNFDRFLKDEKRVFEMSKIGNEHIFDEQVFKDHYNKRLSVSCFIAELFCRNPHNFALIMSHLQSRPKKLDLKFFAKEDSSVQTENVADILNKYFHGQIYNDVPDFIKYDVFIRSYFEIFDVRHINSDWRILWGEKENNLGILADMPIIYRDFEKLQNFSELAIPISRDKVLIYGKNLRIKEEEKRGGSELYEKLAVFAMAEEFVIGGNKEWIGNIANLYYQFVDKYGENQTKNCMINRFFDCFETEN